MFKLLIIVLITTITISCSKDENKYTQTNINNNNIDFFNPQDQNDILNFGLIQTENGVIDLNKNVKIEYQGEFKIERPLNTKLQLSEYEIDFGTLKKGEKIRKKIYIKNIGVDSASNIKILIPSFLKIKNDDCSGITLFQDQECSFDLEFKSVSNELVRYSDNVIVSADINAHISAKVVSASGLLNDVQLYTNYQDNEIPIRNKKIYTTVFNKGQSISNPLVVKYDVSKLKIISNNCDNAKVGRDESCSFAIKTNTNENFKTNIEIKDSLNNNLLNIVVIKNQDKLFEINTNQKQQELAKQKAELERQKELERQAELARKEELAKQQEIAKQKAELEKQKELERQAELAKQKELERQAELAKKEELERQAELAKQQEIAKQKAELERQAELAKQQEIAKQKAELERQAELAKQQEIAKQKELERQAELAKQQEIAKQKAELERLAELARQEELERQKAELERQKAELERQKAELARKEELEKQTTKTKAEYNLIKKESDVINVPIMNSNKKLLETQGLTISNNSKQKLEISVYNGLTPYSLFQRVVPNYIELLGIEITPLKVDEQKNKNNKNLVEISPSNFSPTINATDLNREINLNIEKTNENSCQFLGVFSYIKCLAGTVSLYVKDLVNLTEPIKINSNENVGTIGYKKYIINQISQHVIPSNANIPSQSIFKGEYYFQGRLLENQNKLFKINGKNIFQVSNINNDKDDSPWKMLVHNNELFFAGLDSNGNSKLFKTNGNKITQLSNIFPNGNDYISPIIVFNNELYLEGMNSNGFLKLFKTDGKKIIQISDTNPNGSDSPSDFHVFKKELYFRAENHLGKSKLFKLNDTGIYQVSDINTKQHDAPEFFKEFNNELFFVAYVEGLGNKLFKTDGEIITQVLNINQGNDEPSDLTVFNNELFFIALNKDNNRKLFKLSKNQAIQVSNIRKGSDFAIDYRNKKSYLTEYNGELFFVAKNENNGFKIFKTDGETVSQITNLNEIDSKINPTGSDFPFNLMVYNKELYFNAYSNKTGLKMFKLNIQEVK